MALTTHAFGDRKKLMLMLTAYIDESGHSTDAECRFAGLGGLVAPLDRWVIFTGKWQAICDELLGGSDFHMKEFIVQPGVGLYKGWTEKQRRELMARLVSAIVECDPEPVAAIVSMEAIEDLHPIHQQFFGDPYMTAFQQVTRGLSLSAIPRDEDSEPETVSMVYAYQSQFGAIQTDQKKPENQGRAEALWHAIKEKTSFGKWMGGYSSDFAKNVPALQAADLFAYEITHEFENQLKRPHLGMRWPLKQILRSAGNSTLLKLFDINVLLQTLLENGYQISGDGITAADVSIASSMSQLSIKNNLIERAFA